MKKRSIEDDRRHYCNDCFPSIDVCCQIETTNFDLNGVPYHTALHKIETTNFDLNGVPYGNEVVRNGSWNVVGMYIVT